MISSDPFDLRQNMSANPATPAGPASPTVEHDTAAQRFQISCADGTMAYMGYKSVEPTALEFFTTQVPPSQRGKGLAELVVEAGFSYAQVKGLQVIPTCSYIAGKFLSQRPHLLRFVAKAKI